MIACILSWFTRCRYAEFLDASPSLANLLYFQPDKLLPLFDAGVRDAQVGYFLRFSIAYEFSWLCLHLVIRTNGKLMHLLLYNNLVYACR